MTEHYSGNDPAKGCALIIITVCLTWVVIIFVVAFILSRVL